MSDLAARMERQNKRAAGGKATAATGKASANASSGAKAAAQGINEGETWEDRHKRYTFHLPIALMDDLEELAKHRGRSKSSLVGDAIELLIDHT